MDGAQKQLLSQVGVIQMMNDWILTWLSMDEKQFSTGLDELGNGYTEGFCSMVFKNRLQWLYGLSQNC